MNYLLSNSFMKLHPLLSTQSKRHLQMKYMKILLRKPVSAWTEKKIFVLVLQLEIGDVVLLGETLN